MIEPRTIAQRCIDHLRTLPPGSKISSSSLAKAAFTDVPRLVPATQGAVLRGDLANNGDFSHSARTLWWLPEEGVARRTEPLELCAVNLPSQPLEITPSDEAVVAAADAEDITLSAPLFAIRSDGRFEMHLAGHDEVVLQPDEFASMLEYLDGMWLDPYRRQPSECAE